MGAVLVHIDLDGDRPHSASVSALAAGRAVASSWGATLYAAIVTHDPEKRGTVATDVVTTLARAGADKIVVAMSDVPIAPLWGAVGTAWRGVLDHLRPRLVLFGADAPSAPELGPRTGARLAARLLLRARAVGHDEVELRDPDGGCVRIGDSGAAVALIGGRHVAPRGDDDVDVVVLETPSGESAVELVDSPAMDVVPTGGAIVALGDDVAGDPTVLREAARLASVLGATLVGGPAVASAGAVALGRVVERRAPLAPELCVLVGNASLDLAGTSSVVRLGTTGGEGVDGALRGDIGGNLARLARTLEEP